MLRIRFLNHQKLMILAFKQEKLQSKSTTDNNDNPFSYDLHHNLDLYTHIDNY